MHVDGFRRYEQEEDATKDLAEFTLANAIFSALVEGHAAEQSARWVACFLEWPCLEREQLNLDHL